MSVDLSASDTALQAIASAPVFPQGGTVCETDQADMLDLLPVGAFIVDQSLVIRRWNRALVDWSGRSEADVVGKVLTDLYPSIAESRYKSRLLQVIGSGLPATFSPTFHKHFLPLAARQGLSCDRMIQQTDVRRIPHTEKRALVVIQDVSYQYLQLSRLKSKREALELARDELTIANRELVCRNQDLQEFSFVASHDLQEPLRKITTFTQLLEDEISPDALSEDGELFLGYIRKSAKRMRSLIQDLLSLSRAGTNQLAKLPVDLDTVVHGVLEDLEIRIRETNADVHVEDLPTIVGDARLLSQLFFNLIGNALKFTTDREPEVRIFAQRDDGCWSVCVEDNGIGIDPQFAEKIFKPFQRLHTHEQFPGSGIGLAVCRKAVSRHGGEISISPNPSGGTRFHFTFPDS